MPEAAVAPRRLSAALRGVLAGPFAWPGPAGPGLAALAALLAGALAGPAGLAAWPVLGLAGAAARAGRPLGALGALLVGFALWTSVLLPALARRFGRVPLPAVATAQDPLGPRSLLTVAAGRHYVVPAAREALLAAARRTAAAHPGAVLRYLDAGFALPGWPMVPHLSHGDGRKVDLAFLYADPAGTPVDAAPSPLGYGAHALPEGPAEARAFAARDAACAGRGARRWDLGWLALRPGLTLDRPRTRAALRSLAAEPAVQLLLLEPTLHAALAAPKLRANPCTVARHDDHVHVAVHAHAR